MKTILIVEDDASLRHAIGRELRAAGYGVVASGDSMAALDELSSGQIDLLLTDIVLPKGKPHGIALARMAKLRRPKLPVLYMTAHRDVVRDESDLDGKLFYKPIDIGELVKATADSFRSQPPATGAI